MRPVSARFLRTLPTSHKAVTRLTVCETFQTGVTPTGTEISMEGGNVKSVADAMIRSVLTLNTLEPWPTSQGDLITPYGNEIFVERGIDFGNGQREWVGLGYYRIDTPDQDDVPDGPITVSAPDRMAGIVDAKFLAPRQFLASISRGQLVTTLITEVYPTAVISWDDNAVRDATIGRDTIVEQDRAQCLQDLVTSVGKIGYWRYDGVFRIETPPAITGSPAWTINAGEQGVMVAMSRSLTRQGAKNAWVVTGEAGDTAPPARGVAIDNNPLSPTYYYGKFGPAPDFFSSPFIVNNTQAITSAVSKLKQSLGLPYQVDLSNIVNPALEPFDVVSVLYPIAGRARSLRSETHVLDEVTIPLPVDEAQQLKTREQLVQLIQTEGA
jgi:hypothetical protein